ncbi:Phosphopantothenate--cysteine ligase 2 [Phytophthora nicotianae]|uniref:Phosphopantothenate--cysteine ligase 2 n=1 Tax=Phytophthora nicotianae TaxID=4792 RepID=A0A0W8D7H8_PHYNI|nr:Phosphopantothenate--cysteine ligase 2 [Phytophthora nicotianae]
MDLTLDAVAKDAFRRDFFLRCFTEREAQALELRFAFLHRVRQYKRLVGRRDLLPRATFISILASILVGKSIILVSERSTALVSVAEAARELLKPFEWTHFYLPFCPVATSSELRDNGLFSEVNTSPFFLGCEGVLSYQKKDSATDQRFRIRNSLYTTHKVSLHLQAPSTAEPNEYPPELLQTAAIVIDIDSDDIYVPEKVEIPELPPDIDEFLLFEVDSFLDAHIELGCRDFFRQCFHTELFRNFILAQHMQFAFTNAGVALESSESSLEHETLREALPDAFI